VSIASVQKPAVITPCIDAIPAELRERPHWVTWKLAYRESQSKPWTKLPQNPRGGSARSNDSTTWGTLDEARAAYESGGVDGIGYMFSESDDVLGVDLDNCRDVETGELDPEAKRIVDAIDSYAELSVSGSGVHIIARGTFPGPRRRKGNVEMYWDVRYFTMTGHVLAGSAGTINECQAAIDDLYRATFGEDQGQLTDLASDHNEQKSKQRSTESVTDEPSDQQIIGVASRAKNGAKFQALWNGELNGNSSQSEADLALCNHLAFYVGPDVARIDSLFRQSGLMRDKWERGDYRSSTIRRAIEGCTDFYDWERVKANGGVGTSFVRTYHRTDIGNAQRLVDAHGHDIRYCAPWKKWLIWDGTRWKTDDIGRVVQRAKATVKAMWAQAVKADDDDERKTLLRHCAASENVTRLSAMIRLAQDEVPVVPSQLDRQTWLLNCPNGTVDLRTGKLRPHRREDLITAICPTPFNSDAGSFEFDRFLENVFVDGAIIAFLQRFFGYALSGDVREQQLLIFHGGGANGKSTLLNAVLAAFGPDYSMQGNSDLMTAKAIDSHPTDRADLFGKRLVICSETSEGRRMNETLIKELTGGERVRARRMREDFWEFAPTHKLILCTNHKPRVRGTDHAIWRRIKLVPFNVRFWDERGGETGPDELRQDKTLPAKLAAEASGILAWCVRGCLAWRREGLGTPPVVSSATKSYRTDEDVIGRFIASACIVSDAARVKFGDFFDALERWCNDGGDNRPSRKSTGQYLESHGFEKRQSTGTWYIGVGLKAERRDD